ncbi:MAG TPA: exonuclease domain-containing protein [Acidimicrobiales bacterium]|jgi:DNA polymerase-3 subunit epsilon
MLDRMGAWAEGQVLGLDFETTGVDRFSDVPVSYALVSVVDGVAVRSWSGLIDPGRAIPADATAVHGITTEQARTEGMPMADAVALVTDAVVAASRRGVPLVGMKLDYDLTILDVLGTRFWGHGLMPRGWRGPVLDAGVLDRHFDSERRGRRTLGDLCAHYGVELEDAHDAWADTVASLRVVFALAERFAALRDADVAWLHEAQIEWHRQWTQDCEVWRRSQGKVPTDPRDYVWPVAPAVLPAA